MVIIQLVFRENFGYMDEEKFRDNQIQYYARKLRILESDNSEVTCNKLSVDNTEMEKDTLCEGFNDIEKSKYNEKIEDCKIVNRITDWREKIKNIPESLIDGTKGCGYCYKSPDGKGNNVWYGDDKGPFKNVGNEVCSNWIKPGPSGKGGTDKKKNIFAEYPLFQKIFGFSGNKGVKHDAVKMHEQEMCKNMRNCGDQSATAEDGSPLCGWCYMGRKGDGVGVGMVRKGGNGADQNETKYSDDYCPWPREIDSEGNKTEFYNTETTELTSWKELDGKEFTTSNGEVFTIDKPGRLISGANSCELLEANFPCFPNFNGKMMDGDVPRNHSKECYDEMWSGVANYEGKKCDSDVVDRIGANLPNSKTFGRWNRKDIPSVEQAIALIPNRAETSKQYNATYNNMDGSRVSEQEQLTQNMFSAKLNSMACYGEAPNPCDNRFRSREYGYARPKECTDSILSNLGLPKTDSRYIPGDVTTHKYYWPLENDTEFRDGIEYDWSNDKFRDELIKKQRELNDFNNVKLGNFTYYHDRDNMSHEYDNKITASLYLYGKIIGDYVLWEDNQGGTAREWVKMCWEDFRNAMRTIYGDKIKAESGTSYKFITKYGRINLSGTESTVRMLRDKIIAEVEIDRYTKFRKRILTYVDENSGLDVPVELLNYGNNYYITKEVYEHKYFPFWRLLPKEYYIKSLFMQRESQEDSDRSFQNTYLSTQDQSITNFMSRYTGINRYRGPN